jgi:hypothetical protein
MPSGGARARSGPPPDPNALRNERADSAGWHVLPATGRRGDPPVWPLDDPQTDREAVIWARLWAKPQATRWETLGQVDEVALYVRVFVRAEKLDAPLAAIDKVRQLGEALGLTIPGLLRNRWQIGSAESRPETPAPTGTDGPAPRSTGSARRRLTVVADGD